MLGVQAAGPLFAHSSGGRSRVSEPAPGPSAASAAPAAAGQAEPSRPIRSGPDARSGGAGEAEAERDAWVVLLSVPGLGPVSFAGLVAAFGSAREVLRVAVEPNGAARLQEAVADASESGDRSADGPGESPAEWGIGGSVGGAAGGAADDPRPSPLGKQLAARIGRKVDDAERCLRLVRALGLTVVTLDDPEYPDRLRRVDMPPPLLFVRGSTASLNPASSVAVVGTRRPTDKGRLIAGWIGSALAGAGAVVVSGLAIGIDGAAHAAVVGEGSATVAVLGGGHARLFPKAHERLADAIVAAGGAVIAELAPETPATRGTFPRRNRLVSGLSDATVVVEAGRRSGALITAGWALEQGRECFLVPGPFDSPASEGCHAFLRSFPGQTRVVCGIAELIEDLGLAGQDGTATEVRRAGPPRSAVASADTGAVLASLGPVERSVAELLAAGPATADELAARAGLSGGAILSALTLLELRRLVVGAYGRYLPAGALARWPGRRRG
jgi:DNA processing protein